MYCDIFQYVCNKYLSSSLLRIANNRGAEKQNLYEEFLVKIDASEEVEKSDENLLLVPSSQNKNIRYIVNTTIGYLYK